MDKVRGFTALAAQSVSDGGVSWIEVMPAVEKQRNGSAWYATITADDLSTLVSYLAENPDRIPIDYDHEGADGGSTRAAGWFTGNAEVRGSSLWAEVKWTPQAVDEIRTGAFRFLSPEWTMAKKDPKSGLLTKVKELIAATLTNRPAFRDMSAVTARELLDSTDLDALDTLYGAGASRLLLALRAQREQDLAAKTDAPSGDDPTTGDQVDLPELAKSIGLAEDADEDAVKAKLAELTKPVETPADENEGKAPEKEDDVAQTDYLKALKLDENSEQSVKVAAALNEKDEKIVALTQQVSDLTAKTAEADQLRGDIEDLKAKDRKRDIEVILAKSVENGQIMPAEKEAMAELFSDNVSGLKTLIATRPIGAFGARKATGSGRDAERYADDVEVDAYNKQHVKGDDPADTESTKAHLRAMKSLTDRGVKESDEDFPNQYLAAVEDANRELAAL